MYTNSRLTHIYLMSETGVFTMITERAMHVHTRTHMYDFFPSIAPKTTFNV